MAFVTVDGESMAEERRIVEDLQDNRIHIVANGRRLGQFANFNRAVLLCYAAGSAWIKPLCADDILEQDALERMLRVGNAEAECSFVFGYYDQIDRFGHITHRCVLEATQTRVVPKREFRRIALNLFNPMGGPSSVMFKAEVVEHVGIFDDRFRHSGDQAFWHRIIERYDVGIVGERPILRYRFHENSVTTRDSRSEARFSDPVQIAREIAARQRPLSEQWFLAERMIGRAVGTSLVTTLALARRREWKAAWRGAEAVLREVGLMSVPWVVTTFLMKLVRTLLGKPLTRGSEFAPPLEETDGRAGLVKQARSRRS